MEGEGILVGLARKVVKTSPLKGLAPVLFFCFPLPSIESNQQKVSLNYLLRSPGDEACTNTYCSDTQAST